jgi:hypothetical protein
MPLSNHYKHELHAGNIDFDADTFHMALMASGFSFDPDAHANWSDVSAGELAAGSGYTAGGQVMAGVAISEDDANDRSDVTWSNVTWTASGGNIGPSPGVMIYKNTGTASTSTIVGYVPFGQELTAFDGNPFTVQNPTVRLT